jgi:GGDEF domain-containing protein
MSGFERRRDEVGTLMSSFNKMLLTIEQQAAEINTFATRLDAAYKELESTNARLKETSFKDEVTGLYNRRFFTLRLEEELSRYRRFNHPGVGRAARPRRLQGRQRRVRPHRGRRHAARGGPDPHEALARHQRGVPLRRRRVRGPARWKPPRPGARLYADRIRKWWPSTLPARKVVTASFGVASLPDDETGTAEDLFRASDEALYAAKRAGKNQVAATPSAQRVS